MTAPKRAFTAAKTTSRGQTTIDYVIGISVFLVVVVFVFGFIPTIFAPFEASSGSNTIPADRSADRLSDDLLVDSPEQPAVLNRTCTVGFFDADGTAPTGCRYDDDSDGANLSAAMGTSSVTNLNVTIRSEGSITQLDGTPLAVGDSSEGNENVVVATRVVLLDGDQHQLYIRVW
jgi:hypothetical protein